MVHSPDGHKCQAKARNLIQIPHMGDKAMLGLFSQDMRREPDRKYNSQDTTQYPMGCQYCKQQFYSRATELTPCHLHLTTASWQFLCHPLSSHPKMVNIIQWLSVERQQLHSGKSTYLPSYLQTECVKTPKKQTGLGPIYTWRNRLRIRNITKLRAGSRFRTYSAGL